MTYTLFAFDLDGTIADSADCVTAAFAATFARHRMPAVDPQDIIDRMGLPLRQVFREVTGTGHDDDEYRRLVADYRAVYRELLPQKTRAFPGIRQALDRLTTSRAICAIATSKTTEFAVASLRQLGLDGYFAVVVGDDTVTRSKPDPEMARRILAETGVDAVEAVVVGDAVVDIEMGRAAGVDTIAVTWGAQSAATLAAAAPTHMIDTAEALTRFV